MKVFKSDNNGLWGISHRGGIVYEPIFTWWEAWRVLWAHLLGAETFEDAEQLAFENGKRKRE